MGRVRALTTEERAEIHRGIREGLSGQQIAGRLRRDPTTVTEEIRRNGGRDTYCPVAAQARHDVAVTKPRPGRTPAVTECRNCGQPLRHSGKGATPGRGLCRACSDRLRRAGDLTDFERLTHSRDDLLDDHELLRSAGSDWRQCAERLGMRYKTFERAMLRARAAGDPRARRIGEVDYPAARKVPA